MVSESWMVPAARTAVAVFAVHSLQRISWNRCECSVGQESRLVNMKQRNLQNCSFLILCELCPCNLLNEIKRIKGNGNAKRSKHFAFSQWFLNCRFLWRHFSTFDFHDCNHNNWNSVFDGVLCTFEVSRAR